MGFFSFSGRIGRMQFFTAELVAGAVLVVAILVPLATSIAADLEVEEWLKRAGPIVALAALPVSWIRWASAVKRARDAKNMMWAAHAYGGMSALAMLLAAANMAIGQTPNTSVFLNLGLWGMFGALLAARPREPDTPSFTAPPFEPTLGPLGDGRGDQLFAAVGGRAALAAASEPATAPVPPATGLAALSGDQLVARAAQIAAIEGRPAFEASTLAGASVATARPGGRSGFGRRRTA